MSKQRKFEFIDCGDRVLCIDVDPPAKGKQCFTRIRVFVEETRVVLEAAEVVRARAALAIDGTTDATGAP
jgi:hypothetical protein